MSSARSEDGEEVLEAGGKRRAADERGADGPAVLQDYNAARKVHLVAGNLNCKINILAAKHG